MPDNYQKLPLQQSLNAMATNRAIAAIERTGKALPCSVIEVNPDGLGYSFVKVKFEVQGGPWTLPPLILPKSESQWLRAPTQKGDFGVTVPADTYLGGVSGYGGVADLTVQYGNMSTLLWVPIGSQGFGAAPDPDKVWVNGPKGAVLGDTAQAVFIDCDVETGIVTIQAGALTWTFGPDGFTMSTGIVAETHIHGEVQTGTGVSGPPES